jgi:hypothetical protein
MKITNYVFRAVKELSPNGEFGVKNDDIETFEWYDTIFPAPSKEDIIAKIDQLKAQDQTNRYQEIRARNYPTIGSQLDTLWHMMDDGTIPGKGSQWYNDILEIKNRYPKDMIITESNE